ncbi:MAG: tetratricopeptide repeat protein [Candidatus Kapaibacterium sp.]
MPISLEELEHTYQAAADGVDKLKKGTAWLIQLFKSDPARAIELANRFARQAYALECTREAGLSHWIIGRASTLLHDFDTAVSEFERAKSAFEQCNDYEALGNVYHCIADVHEQTNNFEASLSVYADAIRYLEGQQSVSCRQTLTRVLNGFGIVQCKIADYSLGLTCFYKALELSQEIGDKKILTQTHVNISTAYMHVGDVSNALESYNTALALAQEMNNELSIAIIRTNIGSIYFQFKDYQSALGHYLQALQFFSGHQYSSPYDGLLTLYTNIGSTFEAMNNYAVALEYFGKALVLARKQHSKWGMMLSYHGIGGIYLKLQDIVKAEEYLLYSLSLSKELDTRLEEAEARLSIALCRMAAEKYEEGMELLLQALSLAYLVESPPTIAKIIEHILDLPTDYLTKAQRANYRRQYRINTQTLFSEQREGTIKQDLLRLELQYTLRQMQSIHLPDDEAEDMSSTLQLSNRKRVDSLTYILKKENEPLHKAPDSISVFTLGGFRLVINGREIDRNDWKNRKKARDIFKYLLLNHRKSVPFDTLIDVLWEDAGARDLLPSLWNAASVIRKILQPELLAQTQSQYLLVQDNCYTLNLGEICFIDFVEFQSLIASADSVDELQRKIPYFEKAIALYQGDFLKEDQLAEWTTFEREKMKEQYLQALMFVAEDCRTRHQRAKATEYLRLALEADRVYEEAYRRLFSLYVPDNDRAEVQKWAKFCIDSYQKEYGEAPPASLRKMMGFAG